MGRLLLCCLAIAFPSVAIENGNPPVKIPAEFPSDFPVYPNATFRSYGPMVKANPSLGNILILETPDSKADILDFYRKELAAQGWKVEKPYSEAPDSLAAGKGARRVSVGVLDSRSSTRRGTLIQLGVNSTPTDSNESTKSDP